MRGPCAAGLDVTQETLTRVLRRSAFDPKAPTLWVLEGLTYYLSEEDNALLFRSMAALSAPGSVFAATMAPQKLVDKLKRRKSKGLMSTWKWGFPAHFEFVRFRRAVSALCNCCNCHMGSMHMWQH